MELTRKHKKCFFIFELIMGIILFALITLSLNGYWKHISKYELSMCQTSLTTKQVYYIEVLEYSIDIEENCMLVNPDKITEDIKYTFSENGQGDHDDHHDDNLRRLVEEENGITKGDKGKEEYKEQKPGDKPGEKKPENLMDIDLKAYEDFEKCKLFKHNDDGEDEYGILPNDGRMQVIVVLGYILFTFSLLFRLLGHIINYYCRKIPDDSEGTKKLNKFDFWSMNLLFYTGCMVVVGSVPALVFKYTETCAESKEKDYDGDTEYYENIFEFYMALSFFLVANVIWYIFIVRDQCCNCCQFPPLLYYILSSIQWCISVPVYFRLSRRGKALGAAVVYMFWGIGYIIFIAFYVKGYPYKKRIEIFPETAGAVAVVVNQGNAQGGTPYPQTGIPVGIPCPIGPQSEYPTQHYPPKGDYAGVSNESPPKGMDLGDTPGYAPAGYSPNDDSKDLVYFRGN